MTGQRQKPARTARGERVAKRARVAVVGHVEWVLFAHVSHIPDAGEVVHACGCSEEPAGGGAAAAVQLARLAGQAMLVTALGDDELGHRSLARLRELGVDVRATRSSEPTRRALTLVDEDGERTITTLGRRLQPCGGDRELPWDELARMDAIYFTAGDARALQAAREARVLVASPRAGDAIGHGVALDALVYSADDARERQLAERVGDDAQLVVATSGAQGGSYRLRSGGSGTWKPAPVPGEVVDSYGCGDSFAAGLTYGLGAGATTADALALAARCAAECLVRNGPYGDD